MSVTTASAPAARLDQALGRPWLGDLNLDGLVNCLVEDLAVRLRIDHRERRQHDFGHVRSFSLPSLDGFLAFSGPETPIFDRDYHPAVDFDFRWLFARALARAFVSDDSSADRSTKPPMLVLLESLAFYRNARVGLVVGALFAVLLYGVRALELLGPVIDIRDYPLFGPDVWFLLLAFVLAATFALLVAIGLTVVEAVRGARGPILIQGENPAVHGGRESDTVLSNRRRLLTETQMLITRRLVHVSKGCVGSRHLRGSTRRAETSVPSISGRRFPRVGSATDCGVRVVRQHGNPAYGSGKCDRTDRAVRHDRLRERPPEKPGVDDSLAGGSARDSATGRSRARDETRPTDLGRERS